MVDRSSVSETVRPLDWLETFTDRGDGSKDLSGWEADSGFSHWYSIEQYFGSDSYGWEVKYDYEVISDHDDPEEAKEAGQAHFEKMVRGALTADHAQTQQQWQPIETAPQDGTPVIVWDDPVRGEAYFETGDKAWWWANTGPGDYVGDAIYPTLWQPLPALPDTSIERDGK